MMRKWCAAIVLLTALACGDDGLDAPRLIGITVTVNEPVLRVTKSTHAYATGVDQFRNPYPLGKVTWTSSNPAIVVDDSGRVTAVALVPEQIVIRAAADGHVGGAAMFTYPAPTLSTLDLSQSPSAVVVGATVQLRVVGTDQSGDLIDTGGITWTVRRTGAGDASVDSAGRITGITAGDIFIRATAGTVQQEKLMTVLPK